MWISLIGLNNHRVFNYTNVFSVAVVVMVSPVVPSLSSVFSCFKAAPETQYTSKICISKSTDTQQKERRAREEGVYARHSRRPAPW